MPEMSTDKGKRVPSTPDPDLSSRVRELRKALGLLQAEFAEKLKVSRPQVVQWEKGTKERPSVEKLLEMANLALTQEVRIWFWRKAGVNLDAIKADFREDVRFRTNSWKSGQALQVPIVRELKVGPNGEILQTEAGSVPLPADRFASPASIACLRREKRPPWVLNDGGLVMVDRSVVDPIKLRRKMTAVLFDSFPVLDQILNLSISSSSKSKPKRSVGLALGTEEDKYILKLRKDFHEATRTRIDYENEEELLQAIAEITRPGFLVGIFDRRYVGEQHGLVPDETVWSLVLRVQLPAFPFFEEIPLSKWQAGGDPEADDSLLLSSLLSEDVRIIGEVVGWIGDQSLKAHHES
jgi:transcriptional regulator with XRE-family HTH domain